MHLTNSNNFTEKFFTEYLHHGFGSLQKRDIDILIMRLLLEDGQFNPNDFFGISHALRISETKVRNLIADVQMRYSLYDEQSAKQRFIELIESRLIQQEGSKVVFIIHDQLLRQYFEQWVNNVKGFTDSSFNKNLVKISPDVLEKVLSHLIDENRIKAIQNKIPSEFKKDGDDYCSIITNLRNAIVDSAGKEASSQIIRALSSTLKIIFT